MKLYKVMPHHHMQHMRNTGPILFMRNENIAYIMPCGTTHTVSSCASCGMHMQASRPPYVYMVHQELLMDVPFV